MITRVLLRLDALPRRRATALIGLPTIDAAVDAALLLLRELPALEAAELMLGVGMELVCEQLRRPLPLAVAARRVSAGGGGRVTAAAGAAGRGAGGGAAGRGRRAGRG